MFCFVHVRKNVCKGNFCMYKLGINVSSTSVNPVTEPKGNVIAFRASEPMQKKESVDTFVKDYEKAKKQAENDKKFQKWATVISLGLTTVLVGLFAHSFGLFGKKVQKAIAKDVSKEKSFKELCLSENMQKQFNDVKLFIENQDLFKELGEDQIPGILFYGEPGGGKNAYIYALTKYLQEKFPGSKLFEANVLKFNDKFFGESENNILKFMENVVKEAKKNPNEKVVLFLDEFDAIARKDGGSNAAHTEKLQDAFKMGFNEVLKTPNIIITAATNKASKEEAVTTLLDEAIVNRFAKKIFVPLPTSEQHSLNFVEQFKKLPEKYVSKELLDPNNPTMKKLCDYIAQDGHHMSFRDDQSIMSAVKTIFIKDKAKSSQITMEHFKEAVLDKADQLNWPPSEIDAFKKLLAL